MATGSEIKEEYTSSLADLTFNSKPLISVLTILAEENQANAKDIVEAIEEHLSRVASEIKLPVLYLIDCIIKNVGGPYTALFSQNIVPMFCGVFEKVDEKTRLEMFKLRQTWKEVMPPKKLFALDVQIHQVDPAWPVTAPSPTIHFNPKFLKQSTPATTGTTAKMKPIESLTPRDLASVNNETLSMQQKLIIKQKELLELQQQKLKLELWQTQVKMQLGTTNPAAGAPAPGNKAATPNLVQNPLLKPEVAKQLATSGTVTKGTTNTVAPKPRLAQLPHPTVPNQKSQGGPRLHQPRSNLPPGRPIRDPRLLRQQLQQRPDQDHLQTNVADANVHLGSKSKFGQADTNNKIVNNKQSVRNTSVEPPHLVGNKGTPPDHPSHAASAGRASPVNTKSGGSPRKSGKSFRSSSKSFSHRDKSPPEPSSSNSGGSPNISPPVNKNKRDRGSSKSPRKLKKRDGGLHDEVVCIGAVQQAPLLPPPLHLDKDAACRTNDKKSDKQSNSSERWRGNESGSMMAATFRSFKGSRGRNYMRRNREMSASPEPPSASSHDVDLRVEPPEKLARLQPDVIAEQNAPPRIASPTKDVDLRQLPAVISSKKRSSVDDSDSPSAKKSKAEMLDQLFGSEDTDLRQLPPVLTSPRAADRPPTPPPPPIISEEPEPADPVPETPTPATKEPESKEAPTSKSNFELLRLKLANAVSKDRDLQSSSPPREPKVHLDTDMRLLTPPKTGGPKPAENKIIISPADEQNIKAGNMTKAQETALMSKILAQIETNKLREAQRRESESIGNISLQPISDDELDDYCNSSTDRPDDYGDRDDRLAANLDRDDRMPADKRHQGNVDERVAPPMVPAPFAFEPRGPAPAAAHEGRRQRTRRWEPPLPMPRPPGVRQNGPPPGLDPWIRPPWMTMGGLQKRMQPLPPPQMMPKNYPGGPDSMGDSPNSYPNQEIPTLQYQHPDSIKSLNIDGQPREIRYYDETAIVFMNWGDPREISFQNGTKRIYFDDEMYMLGFNEPYREIAIRGVVHRVRLGAPSREIFIDGKGYECYFDGGEKSIELDGRTVLVRLQPPPPQVKIGNEKRTDLVAGKINIIIDAKNMFPVFLDGKTQTFEMRGATHTVKFEDSLHGVLIDDRPFPVEFGGLPKPLVLHGVKHFVRFSALPKGIKPGHVNIVGMEGSTGWQSPRDAGQDDGSQPYVPGDRFSHAAARVSPDRNSNSPHHFQNMYQQQNLSNLDLLSNVMMSSMMATSDKSTYEVENSPPPGDEVAEEPEVKPPVSTAAPQTAAININDLFQRLVDIGIVTTAAAPVQKEPSPPPAVAPPPAVTVPAVLPTIPRQPERKRGHSPITFGDEWRKAGPPSFGKPETLKIRRPQVFQDFYLGMQCSGCGMRFPPEQSMYYSQHLDWHFRQNRKGKKNIRKAASRRWYYTLMDWKKYEEHEDLEEREKCYFDNPQSGEGGPEDVDEEIEIPTVPADPNIQEPICEVCQDRLEQFFSEEKDEWQLRMAIRVGDKTYHPLCYEDYQASLVDVTLDESKTSAAATEPQPTDANKIPGLESLVLEILKVDDDDDEDDDELQIIDDKLEVVSLKDDTVVSEENAEEEGSEYEVVDEEMKADEEKEEEDDDVIIHEIVPDRIVLDDDDNKDGYIVEEGTHAPPLVQPVKIKKEDEVLDDGFMDVENGVVKMKGFEVKIKSEPIDPDYVELEKNPSETVDTTQAEVVSTIDGNVELLDSGAAQPVAGGVPNRIRINITKSLASVQPKEPAPPKEMEPSPMIEFIDPSQPLPPGEEPIQLNVKPALQGLGLKAQPVVKRGHELTGMCSIM